MTAQTILPANTLSGGYDVDNSLRFNDGSTDYLSKTFTGTQTNNKKATISCWWKRSSIGDTGINGGEQTIISWNTGQGNRSFLRSDGGSDQLYLGIVNNAGDYKLQITPVQRDISAWYHIVAHVDTTQSTASNRMKIYINGVEVTDFDSTNYIPQDNTDIGFGEAEACEIGRDVKDSNTPLDGYLAEMVFIDGQALDPTSFGEFDSDSGIWKPIDVSGLTFGTNGFYLEFKESGTGTNASGMGADTSGNTNHFAVNNLTAVDQSIDTCTNNFATLNSLENFYPAATISEGNLKAVTVTAKYTFLRSTIGVSSGKWYMEVKCTAQSGSTNKWTFGITDHASTGTQNYIGQNSNSYGWRGNANEIFYNGTSADYGSGAMATGNIIGIALDLDNNKMYFSINGTFKNSGDPAGNSNGFSINAPNGFYHFAFGDIDGDQNFTYETNFGSPSFAISSGNTDGNGYGNFEYAVPSGYYSLNSKNLAEYG